MLILVHNRSLKYPFFISQLIQYTLGKGTGYGKSEGKKLYCIHNVPRAIKNKIKINHNPESLCKFLSSGRPEHFPEPWLRSTDLLSSFLTCLSVTPLVYYFKHPKYLLLVQPVLTLHKKKQPVSCLGFVFPITLFNTSLSFYQSH